MRIAPFAGEVIASIRQIINTLQKRVDIENNLDCVKITVSDTGSANAEFTVTHNLGRVPTVYFYRISKSGTVYDSSTGSWSSTIIKLKCSAANAALVLVIF